MRNAASRFRLTHSNVARYSRRVNRFPKMLALVAGGLSALGFAPLGWWPLTILCLAVLTWRVLEARSMKAALAFGYWFGVGHFAVGLNWIAGAFQYQDTMPVWLGWFAVVALALYIAIYPAMAAGLAWRWGRGPVSTTFIFGAAWTVTEWLRATMFTGFAWNPLSVAMIDTGLAQSAEYVGTYALSGVMVVLAGLVLAAWKSGDRRAALAGLGVVALIWAGGEISLRAPASPQASNGILLRIVQPNIGQQDKYEPGYDGINFDKLARLTGVPGPVPRLILWPEAAIPNYLDEATDDAAEARAKIATLMGPQDILLTGGVKRHFKSERFEYYIERTLVGARNNVWGMDKRQRLLFRYDKAHLVPYGEYLPMKPVLSAIGLSRLVPGDIDFWPGPGPQTYAAPGFGKVGIQVCYEIIFSGQVVDPANRPDFLFNPSNDAWFGAWGPPQHLAQARLRAIEEGLPVVRSTPTGISAVVDAQGRLLAALPYQRPGFIQRSLPVAEQPTLFARSGNILAFGVAIFLAAIGVALRRKQR